MKRKLKILAFCLLTVLMISTGCKKDTDKKESCRITRLTRNGTVVYEIKYGDNGKISSLEPIPGKEKHTYAYEGNKVIITATYNGNFDYRYVITTNKNGFATNVRMEFNEAGSIWNNKAITYEGTRVVSELETESGSDNSATNNYTWEGGNPAVFMIDNNVFNYEYYTDKNYQPGDWLYIQQLLWGYKKFEYKNLVKSTTGNSNTTFYTYNFDDAGRITEAKSTSPNATTIFKIEYACD
jgi:hypothetical protein